MKAFVEPVDPLLGATIDGRYLVRSVLGRGGMGVVYEGVHEHLGRPVAIKVMSAAVSGNHVAVERFLREARIASTLTHGNIVDVSDLGQLPDGRPYLVMPKLDGEDLCTMLGRLGPLAPSRVVELLRGAAAALDLIHAKGMVHRDVKPENLMHVVREDGSEAVLLLDFGIVGLVASKAAARLTAEGSIFGTPAYLPPEIVETTAPDRRGDVYALATVAFELMTGRLPFESDNPLKILPMKISKNAPSMSSYGPPVFPDAIEAVIARGLVRNPEQRQASAGGFIAELDQAVRESADGRGAAAAGPPPVAADKSPTSPLDLADLDMSLASDELSSSPLPPADADLTVHAVEASRSVSETQIELPQNNRRILVAVLALTGLGVALGAWAISASSPRLEATPASLPMTAAAHRPAVPPALEVAQPAPAAAIPAAVPEAAAAPTAAAVVPAAAHELHAAPAPHAPPATGHHSPARNEPVHPQATTIANTRPAPTAPPPTAAPQAAAAAPAQTKGLSADALNQSATQAMLQGHLGMADELYGQAVRVDAKNEASWRGLGLVSERLGRKDDAIRAFRRVLQLSPEGPHAQNIRSRLQQLETSP